MSSSAAQGDDLLIGNGGADVLRGGAGDDILRIGNDFSGRFDGGLGDDTCWRCRTPACRST